MKAKDLTLEQTVYHKEDGECEIVGLCIEQGVRITTGYNAFWVHDASELSLTPFKPVLPHMPESHTHYLTHCGEIVELPKGSSRREFFGANEMAYKQGNTGTNEAMNILRNQREDLFSINTYADCVNVKVALGGCYGVFPSDLSGQPPVVKVYDPYTPKHKPFKTRELAQEALKLFPKEFKTILAWEW